ncbi:MAG: type II secretion system F family protein, partial [Acidimicrobiales bacterium]
TCTKTIRRTRSGLVLGARAAGLGAYALATLVQKNPSGLDSVLLPYADPFAAQLGEQEKTGFAKSLLLKRAVEITEGFAERRGVLVRVEAMLERADLPLRAGEAMTAMAGVVFGSFVVGLLLGRTLIAGLVFALLGVLVPPAVVNFLAGRREKAFRGQLPDTLQLLSSTLKAGYSFMQGVEAVSQEVEEPMGGELRRVMTEAQLGRPVEEALDASAERMDSPDFAWAIMALRIQREVGGNLSELLLTVADTMTARERLRRDVAALTAEGKISAIVLGALPVLLGVAMYVINPDYISTLFEDSFGKIILGVSVVAALAGFAWMKKIINIDI